MRWSGRAALRASPSPGRGSAPREARASRYRTCGQPSGAWRVVARRKRGHCRAARTIARDSGALARTRFLRVCGVRNDAVAPGLLRQIERFVGTAQQLFGFLGVIGECGNPEGDGDGPERLIVIPKLELCNFLTKLLGLAARGVERALGQEHEEFLASVPAGDVGLPRKPPEHDRQLPQHQVACFVAEAVVEALELVDVQHDGGDRPAVALRAAQLQAEPLLYVMAVVEGGGLFVARPFPPVFAPPPRPPGARRAAP